MASDKSVKEVDWVAVETDYRLGMKPLRHIADEHGITEGAIRKRAKRDKWVRDLTAKVKAKAEELVRKAEVRESVRKEQKVTEVVTIEVAARNQADIILAQREGIPPKRNLLSALLTELTEQTANLELFEKLGELMYAPDDKGVDKLNEIYHKVIDTPSRIDSAKKLIEASKILMGMERQAFGISDNANGEADKPPAQAISDLEAARRIAFALARAEKAK